MVHPTGFGAEYTGLKGTGFQLLVIIFTESSGVTPAQPIWALAQLIRVWPLALLFLGSGLPTRKANDLLFL